MGAGGFRSKNSKIAVTFDVAKFQKLDINEVTEETSEVPEVSEVAELAEIKQTIQSSIEDDNRKERVIAFYDENNNLNEEWKKMSFIGFDVTKWIYLSYYNKGCFYLFPKEIIHIISSFLFRFKVNHSLIKAIKCSGKYSSIWRKEYTLNHIQSQAWFTPPGESSGWIIYDLSDNFLFNKFSLKINANGVRDGTFQIFEKADKFYHYSGPWKDVCYFRTTTITEAIWNRFIIGRDICARYIRIYCQNSHGAPTGFYEILIE